MIIGIIQASTQIDKNNLLYNLTKKAVSKYGYEVINFGVTPKDKESYSYTEIALMIALLINSKAVDFVVTGCSSGQGMNLACNTLPGILSGFVQTPQDAFLFGRINGGNVASLPLGLGFGWQGDLNLEYILEKLFEGDFGIGYPIDMAERKVKNANEVKKINLISKREFVSVLNDLDKELVNKILSKNDVIEYIIQNSKEDNIVQWLSLNITEFK